MTRTHRSWQGIIEYVSHKPERMNENRGRETFTLHEQTNGTSVLHTHTEIDDAPDVLRDVTASFETNRLAPIDGFSRLSVGGVFEGCGWFQFDEGHARFSGFNTKLGPNQAEIALDSRTPWFGHHAIINDGFLGRLFPLDAKPGKIKIKRAMMSSPDHRGATGPELFPLSFSLVYEGDETITVGAGTFDARVFAITDTAEGLPEEHPPYRMWCEKTPQGFFLQGGVGGYMQTWYELIQLEELP